MKKLDKNFKCPKSLKISMIGQSRDLRLTMYEAYQCKIEQQKKSHKSKDSSDKE